MRLIDADALHDMLKTKQKWVVRCGDKHNEGYTYDQVHFAIDDAPSIDLVFCKECERANHELSGVYCGLSDMNMGENGCCSVGKRKESE